MMATIYTWGDDHPRGAVNRLTWFALRRIDTWADRHPGGRVQRWQDRNVP